MKCGCRKLRRPVILRKEERSDLRLGREFLREPGFDLRCGFRRELRFNACSDLWLDSFPTL